MSARRVREVRGGVGMPASLYLEEFGAIVAAAFAPSTFPAFHVGSSLTKKRGWRDVDVRLILTDEEYAALGLGDPTRPFENAKWCALVQAFSALGVHVTGLPVDFQIQQQTDANARFPGPRGALVLHRRRLPSP